jgi:phosphate transport system substrate-binding protein
MQDEFLHRLRKEPRPEFAVRLQAQLRRQSKPALHRRAPSRLRTLIVLLLLGGTAFAVTTVVMKGLPTALLDMYQRAADRLAGERTATPAYGPPNDGVRERLGRRASGSSSVAGAALRSGPGHSATTATSAPASTTSSAAPPGGSPPADGPAPETQGLQIGAVSSGVAYGQITGAGSTSIYPLIVKWAAAYAQKTGVQINYQPIGSGGGIQQIKTGRVAFAASDMPLRPDVLRQNHLIQFPTAVAGEDIVYNLPSVQSGQLLLTGPLIADIYLGKITKWNDPALEKLNPSIRLPDMTIGVVHRSDGSGTTFTFTDYLSKVSAEWKRKVGESTAINWPVGIGGKGNQGVASYVHRIQGSIGYVEYAYIIENHMNYARMINSSGKVVSPSLQGFQAAAANVDFTEVQDDSYVILTDQPGEQSWPISGYTWQILRTTAPISVNAAVVKFFGWGFEYGQGMAESSAFGPLPASTVGAIVTYWKWNLGK